MAFTLWPLVTTPPLAQRLLPAGNAIPGEAWRRSLLGAQSRFRCSQLAWGSGDSQECSDHFFRENSEDSSTGLQNVPAVGYSALDTYLPRNLGWLLKLEGCSCFGRGQGAVPTATLRCGRASQPWESLVPKVMLGQEGHWTVEVNPCVHPRNGVQPPPPPF